MRDNYFCRSTTLLFTIFFIVSLYINAQEPMQRIDGYRGIWFELGQKSEYGDKYSGGLGTYTAKHHPLAVYSKEANKTFFVYGGTTASNKRELLAMLSYYDHQTGKVPKPVVVHAKTNVKDPHDNPSIQIDKDGYLWIFISGRSTVRLGYVYKSTAPYSIDKLEQIEERQFAYPQPTYSATDGFLFLFTKYTNGRELYWSTSSDGKNWSADHKLAAGGHYQMTNRKENKVITAFNVHPSGSVDKRTNLYYLQTTDNGKTWTTANGTIVKTPVEGLINPALIRDYQSENKLVYVKDINFDTEGNPVLLYVTSNNYQPGPNGAPRTWTLAHWKNNKWNYLEITNSTHNYDMGSLYTEDNNTWRIIAPTGTGPQQWGAGGEMVLWVSNDQGESWKKEKEITKNSVYNHGYARRPLNAHPDFYAFWADGHANNFSESRIYFTNSTGSDVYQLPYTMTGEQASPIKIQTTGTRRATLPAGDFRINRIYPDPTEKCATVEFDTPVSGHFTIKIIDIRGRVTSTESFQIRASGKNEIKTNVGVRPGSVYLLQLYSEKLRESVTEKIIWNN